MQRRSRGISRVAAILLTRRIPATSQFRTFPDGGGLMSYGPDLTQLYRRVGLYVSKILHGAAPADLPIEVERDEVRRLPNSLTHSHCPYCGVEHVWWTSEGRFVETLPPEDWIENKQ